MASRQLRVAIVGSGPSGIYAADALTSQEEIPVSVDIIDRLPVPFGLVRYGVAPDHFSIRSVRGTLEKVLDRDTVRFVGNVAIGEDVSLADLRNAYDAVVLTYGAARDRRLGVPGEDLPGSIAATDLVNWYCGHPDALRGEIETEISSATTAVVIGVGNVAVDVVRVLAKSPAELEATDMPQHVLDLLAADNISDVYLVGRRGPAQATFTTKELRELGELSEAEVMVAQADVELDPVSAATVESDRLAARNVEVIREWSTRTSEGKRRRIHICFFTKPVEILGSDRVSGIVLERTALDAAGGLVSTGETFTVKCDLVVRSVGYRGVGLDDAPFDSDRAVVPNVAGRVLEGGAPVTGLYVAGWIKRGPSGIIGTNKKDAAETAQSLLADALSMLGGAARLGIDGLLPAGHQVVHIDGWRLVDAGERAAGVARGRERTTEHDRARLLDLAAGR